MRYSKELVIGLTTIVTIISFVWGFHFLKGKNVFSAKQDFFAFYENVHGLDVGQPVTINGYKIGQVTSIDLKDAYIGKLLVGFHISKPIDIASDSKAKIYDMDIMGAKGIQLVMGASKTNAVSGDTLVGEIQISLTEQVTKQFVPIKAGTEKLMGLLESTLQSITLLSNKATALIDANEQSLTNAVGGLDTLAVSLSKQRAHFDKIITNLSSFSEGLAKSDLDSTILNFESTLNNIDVVLADIKAGKGSLGKMTQDESLYQNMDESMKQLEKLLEDLRENPKRYVHFSLFGKKQVPVDTLK